VISVTDRALASCRRSRADFHEFFQTSDKRAAELGGTGLGLAITGGWSNYRRVIWLKSAPERGSTFFVAFRVSRAHKVQTVMHPVVQQAG
jgi:signal transduction histidine kinase